MVKIESAKKSCVIKDAIDLIQANTGKYEGPTGESLARILRLLVEIRQGKGMTGHLDALYRLAGLLEDHAEVHVGVPLLSLMKEENDEFIDHIKYRTCAAGTCFVYKPAPCQAACPAHIDIPAFIALIGQGRYDDATEIILKDTPFPWTCGLVCPHPCEDACLRGEMDEPVHIQLMKAYTAKISMNRKDYRKPLVSEKRFEKVAIIGAGPSGLSAACYLAVKGYETSIFEALPKAGGMLRVGIPSHRLPKDILDQEIENILSLGVHIKTNMPLGPDLTIDKLFDQGFRAVYLSIGAHKPIELRIKGEKADGVMQGVTYLKKLNLGEPVPGGKKVVIIGGGNVAIDVARSAVRKGADEVTILYRRTRKEMPAHDTEVEGALEEGVDIAFLLVPEEILVKDNKVAGLRCIKMKLGEPDASGRRIPIPVPGSEHEVEADLVLPATGQVPDISPLKQIRDLEISPRGTIKADPITLATGMKGVFAGGDAVKGPTTVVEAIACGKKAAVSMDCYLRGKEIPDPICVPKSRRRVDFLPVSALEKVELKRSRSLMIPVEERENNFQLVEQGLTDEMALNEAKRCLRCDRCVGDGLCQFVCSEMGPHALRLSQSKDGKRSAYFDFENTHKDCIGCGSCAAVCPHGNIQVHDEDDLRKISFCGTVIAELILERCKVCGKPYAPQKYIDFVLNNSDKIMGVDAVRGFCAQCARKKNAERIAGLPSEV